MHGPHIIRAATRPCQRPAGESIGGPGSGVRQDAPRVQDAKWIERGLDRPHGSSREPEALHPVSSHGAGAPSAEGAVPLSDPVERLACVGDDIQSGHDQSGTIADDDAASVPTVSITDPAPATRSPPAR